jgi:dienelactone hydrolase
MIRNKAPETSERASPGIRVRLGGAIRALVPGPHAWRGAAAGLLAATAMIWLGFWLGLANSPFSLVLTLVVATALLVAGVLLGNLVVELLELFGKLPLLYRWRLVTAVFLLALLFGRVLVLPLNAVGVIIGVVVAASLFGASLAVLLGNYSSLSWPKRAVTVLGLLVGGGMTALAGVWLLWPGPSYALPPSATWAATGAPALALADPSRPGDYPVLTLTYGSDTDGRRPEYAEGAAVVTETVDISGMVGGWSGAVGWLRTRYWSFDLTQAPLNARVLYPDGEGPFPFVLVVHGNHAMDAPSEGGYGYLGELLASRGFILASVDQNFLNGGGIVEAILGGLQEENDARGYLLLEHLRLWHAWNRNPESPLYGKVDTGNIALVGHSRGGEAAAIAAAMNGLGHHPDNALVRMDHDYAIRTVIAIAPSDGQYTPRGQGTPLANVNYLVLQGAADGDVRSFQGASQYDRVAFSDDDWFKAAVYIYGANHGQFNTSWGRADTVRWILNLGEIMPKQEQERIGKVFMAAFLEATLRGEEGYLALFRNPARGRAWLPEGIYLSQFMDSSAQLVATFEEDLDAFTTSLPGGRIHAENLTEWREGVVAMGRGSRETVAAFLGWNRNENAGAARYRVILPRDFESSEEGALVLALADGRGAGVTEGLDLTLELSDRRGEVAGLPLSHIMPLPPQLTYRTFKPPLKVPFLAEPVFTSYDVPLEDFAAVNPALDLIALWEISLVFDRSPAGTIILGDLGFRR